MHRRIRPHHATTTLPLRVKNDEYPQTGKTHPTRGKFSKKVVVTTIIIILSITLLVSFILWESVQSFFGTPSRTNSLPNAALMEGSRRVDKSNFYRTRPLDQFSELTYALEHSQLVLLYFAASWCPMSTPISIALDKAFGRGDILLTRNGKKKTLAIVYVSSDETLEEYKEYTRKRQWLPIPFDSPDKNNIKRHFATCAHRELEELHFDRKHEIPTGIVIDSRTQGIITTNGADDVEKMGDGALERWLQLQEWVANSIAHINDSPME